MKNSKDNTYKDWINKEKSDQSNLVREKAQAANFFQDLTFGEQHQGVNRTNKSLKALCNVASFVTGTVALWLVMSFIMGVYLAGVVAGVLSVLFERKKNQTNSIGFKHLLKYKDNQKSIVWPMIGAAVLSMSLAVVGAFQAPKINPLVLLDLKAKISIDSIITVHSARVDAAVLAADNLWDMHKKPRKGQVGHRWSTHKNAQPAKDLHNKKIQLIIDEKKAMAEAVRGAELKNKIIYEENRAAKGLNFSKHQDTVFLNQLLLVILAIFIELFYSYLCFETAYYLLRVDIDNRPDHYVGADLESLKNQSLLGILKGKSQSLNSMQFDYTKDGTSPDEVHPDEGHPQTPIVKTSPVKTLKKLNPGHAICELPECGADYKYFRVSQKYCNDECRKAAHMKKKLQEKLEEITKLDKIIN